MAGSVRVRYNDAGRTHPDTGEKRARNRGTWHPRGFMCGIMEWEVDHNDYYLRLWILEIKRNVRLGRRGWCNGYITNESRVQT